MNKYYLERLEDANTAITNAITLIVENEEISEFEFIYEIDDKWSVKINKTSEKPSVVLEKYEEDEEGYKDFTNKDVYHWYEDDCDMAECFDWFILKGKPMIQNLKDA